MKNKKMLGILATLLMIVMTIVCTLPCALAENDAAIHTAIDIDNETKAPCVAWQNENEKIIGTKTALVFEGRLDRHKTLHVADVENYEDVPFVSTREYMALILGDDVACEMDKAGNVFRITRNDVDIELNLSPLSLRCDDWDGFAALECGVPNPLLYDEELNAIACSTKNTWESTPAHGSTISLELDGLCAIPLEDDVLMPFSALQNTIGASCRYDYMYAYNGDDFYDLISLMDGLMSSTVSGDLSPYFKAYYSGPYADKTVFTPAFARYNYATTCLMLDTFYGHKREKDIESIDSYIEHNGLKAGMMSADPGVASKSLQKLISGLFDTGHDMVAVTRSVFGANAYFKNMLSDDDNILSMLLSLVNPVLELGAEQTKSLVNSLIIEIKKSADYDGIHTRIDLEGDTAFIYLDAFSEDLLRETSYYAVEPGEDDLDKSTFALFYEAFRQIEENGNIKNVVIDLSANDGGAAGALIAALGFMAPDGEVRFTYMDERTGSYHTEWYHVDTDLNGRFDDSDGYGDKYNFYVLTSKQAYSCGTALPFFAQQNGLAKIVGEQPGGGDCVLGSLVDAAGRIACFSSNLKIGVMKDGEFVSDEHAVTPDIPFTAQTGSLYFDRPAIARLIGGDPDLPASEDAA